MNSAALLLSLGLTALAAHRPAPAAGIEWQPDYAAALERAADEGKVVFVAMNMDGEGANDRMAKEVYRDKRITALAERTLPLVASTFTHSSRGDCRRFGTVPCSAHRTVDTAVREELLKPDAEGFVVAPQHVFLGPKGDVLLSVPYEISADELEWCFATALTLADPSKPVRPSSKARAPKRLIMGDVFDLGSGGAKTLTRDEALELIKELKKGKMSREEAEIAVRNLITVDEAEAIEFVTGLLRGGGGGRRGGGERGATRQVRILHAIGVWSPLSWAELVSEYAVGGREDLRREAIVALEQIGSPDSLKRIQEGLRKEKDPTIKKNYLRALGSAGATSSATLKTLRKTIERDKSELLRANAIVALGYLPSEGPVRGVLLELAEVPEKERGAKLRQRIAAACAMGLSRDAKWKPALEALRDQAEKDGDQDLGAAADAALAVLRAGNLSNLRRPIRKVCEDELERERLFGSTGT